MAIPITRMGKFWEWRHSVWLVWLLFPFGFTAFISFLIIGVKMKNLKWLLSGFVYMAAVIQVFVIQEIFPVDSMVYDFSIGIILIGWIIACVHAFSARRVYLKRLEKMVNEYRSGTAEQKRVHAGTVPLPASGNLSHVPKKKASGESRRETSPSVPGKPVDMNAAGREEIAAIPSIGNILAGKIIDIRERHGHFESFSHFVSLTEIQPHVLAKAKPWMVFPEDRKEDPPSQDKLEEKDGEKYRAGRIVDF